jgi:hypothetical protein
MNYFIENADLVTTFDRVVPWDRLVPLTQGKDANVAETVATWREMLSVAGEYIGTEVAGRAKEMLIEHTLQTKEAMMAEAMMQVAQTKTIAGSGGEPGDGGGSGSGEDQDTGSPVGAGQGRSGAAAPGGSKNGGGRTGHPRKAPPVAAANHGRPQIPTGPNGPGADGIPGGNR